MDKLLHYPLGKTTKREIHYDELTPIQVYSTLGGIGSCMFESAYDEGYGKYSFIGINPLATFSAIGNHITIDINGTKTTCFGNPYEYLRQFSGSRKCFGFVAYDAVRLKEKIPDRHAPKQTPDFLFRIYKTIIEFEHNSNKIN